MDSQERVYREKYLKYKQKYLDLKGDMEGGKCGMMDKLPGKKANTEEKYIEAAKNAFTNDAKDVLASARSAAKKAIEGKLNSLKDQTVKKALMKEFDDVLCVKQAGIMHKMDAACGPKANFGKKLAEEVNKKEKAFWIEADKKKTKPDCEGKKFYTSVKRDNKKLAIEFARKIGKEVHQVEVKGEDVPPTLELMFIAIGEKVIKENLKSKFDEFTKGKEGIAKILEANAYPTDNDIAKAIVVMNKVTDQLGLNKRCADPKVKGLLDSDIPSCTEESLKLVDELLGSITETQTKFKKSMSAVDSVDKAYGSFSKEKSPKVLREDAIKDHKDAYTKALVDKLGLTKEQAVALQFNEKTNEIENAELKKLVQTKVSSLPDKLTETPTGN